MSLKAQHCCAAPNWQKKRSFGQHTLNFWSLTSNCPHNVLLLLTQATIKDKNEHYLSYTNGRMLILALNVVTLAKRFQV